MNEKYLDNVLYLEHFKYNATQNALLTILLDTNLQNGIFVFYKKMLQLYRKGSKIPIIGTNLKKNCI